MGKYVLIIQQTTTKKISSFNVVDELDAKQYYHFCDVDFRDLDEGEYRYFLVANEEEYDLNVYQNDPRLITHTEDKYIIVAYNKFITAQDILLATTYDDYQVPADVVASGLLRIGEYVDKGQQQYDKPTEYKQYTR